MNDFLHDRDERVAEYNSQFAVAADSLLAAIQTRVTDGAETVSHLLATVAANLGGVDQITAGRPGSWEADHVQQFLSSTVGPDGEYLLQFRTRPIEVVECVELAMVDLDIDFLYDESLALVEDAETEAADEGDDAAWDRLDHAGLLIDQLRTSDYATYRDAFEVNIREATRALTETRHLPIDVPVSVRWVDWKDHEETTGSQDIWGTIEYELWESARAKTPPPGFAELLHTIPISPADHLRTAGRMPHQRIPEIADYAKRPTAPGVA